MPMNHSTDLPIDGPTTGQEPGSDELLYDQPAAVSTSQLDRSTSPSGLQPLPDEVSYGAVIDIRNVEQEITELMIRRACEQMDEQQQFPFCSSPRRACALPRMRRAG